MVGLHYLKYLFDESDESAVAKFVENPYWQFFCGGEYFEHELPCHPTNLVKWRRRIGADGMEKLLTETLSTAKREQALRESELKPHHLELHAGNFAALALTGMAPRKYDKIPEAQETADAQPPLAA